MSKTPSWPLIRDTIIFQLKLGIDALRDLLLSPVSIVCAVIDLFKRHEPEQSYFYKLMRMGHKSDLWLNLFSPEGVTKLKEQPLANAEQKNDQSIKTHLSEQNVDQIFEKIENLLKEQHKQGGVTASAKSTIDRYLNKMLKKEHVASQTNTIDAQDEAAKENNIN
jgi:hypothetical protein